MYTSISGSYLCFQENEGLVASLRSPGASPEAEVGDTDDVCCIAALTDIGPLPSGFILQRSLGGGAGVSYLYRVPPLQSR